MLQKTEHTENQNTKICNDDIKMLRCSETYVVSPEVKTEFSRGSGPTSPFQMTLFVGKSLGKPEATLTMLFVNNQTPSEFP